MGGGGVNRWALLPPSFSQRLTPCPSELWSTFTPSCRAWSGKLCLKFPSAQVCAPLPLHPNSQEGKGAGAWSGGRGLRKRRVTGCGRGPPKGKAEGCGWGPGAWGGRGRGLDVWVES